jgi:hypothetical protein
MIKLMLKFSRTRALFGHVAFIPLTIALTSQSFAATITAASASQSAVQAAINAAANGDTVLVPSGSATWGAGAVMISKGIRLKGAAAWTAGTTTITLGGVSAMTIGGNGQYLEVSGFTFLDSASGETSTSAAIRCSGMFRVCSNIFNAANHPIVVWGSRNDSSLIDNNVVNVTGASFIDIFGDDKAAWDYGTTYGTTNYCYIEHNRITCSGIGDGIIDCYGGAKFVFRYNITTNGYWGWHGCDSTPKDSGIGWSPHSYEIYGNRVYYSNGGYYCIFNSRGGTGLMFSNSVSGRTDSGSGIYLQYYRQSQPGQVGTWGVMNGSNPLDGNVGTPSGWPGLCQQGRTGPTTGYAKTGSGSSTTQVSSPTYIWNNDAGYTVGTDASCIQLNRDYFLSAAPGYTPLVDPHPMAGGVQAPDTNPPSITAQPQNAAVVAGSPATFSVAAKGGGTLTYQWAWCGTNVTGATANSWTTPTTVPGNSNSVVSVRVASTYGGVTSTNAYLYVMNGIAPTITTQPTSRTSGTGGSTTFAVTAIGTAPLAYQWRFNSSPINGATASSYTVGSVATNNAGSYTVAITNSYGSVTSAVAILTVTISTQTVHYYYVATTGNDSGGNGSIGSPWATLEGATSKMKGGDVLYVRGGTYSEVFDLYGPNGSNSSLPTIIINYPGETPIFDHTGNACSMNGLNWFVLGGLTMRNYQQAILVGYAAACSNTVLTNLTVYNTGNQGIQVYNQSHHVLLVNNLIYGTGTGSQNGEGIYIGNNISPSDNTHDVTMRGNTIHDTKDEAIELKPGTYNCIIENSTFYTCNKSQDSYGAGGGAIEVDAQDVSSYSGNPNHVIRGNIVYDTVIGIHLATGSSAYNNIIYGTTQYGIKIDTANGTADSWPRLVYNNTVARPSSDAIVGSAGNYRILNNIGPTGSYNLATNATYFVNMSGHDYHLVAGRAPIAAGTNVFGVVATDFAGNARPSSGAFDIGAYQYAASGGSASPPPPTGLRVAGQ